MAYHSSPNQLANLKPFKAGEQRDPVRASEIARKAGKAGNEARRRRKRMTEAAKWLLGADNITTEEEVLEKLRELGIDDATNAEAMMVVAVRKAMRGDVEALKFVRDTAGESPSNRVELTGDPDRPVATLDLRGMSEEELLRLAEAKADEEAN